MGKQFKEIVIHGPHEVIVGFLYGLLAGAKNEGGVIFSRENNIKRETLFEMVLEWAHLHEHLCHIVVEEELLPLIEEGLRNTENVLKLSLKSVRKVRSASLEFEYEVYAKKYAEEIKNIFATLPESLRLSPDYQPKEEIHPEGEPIDAYAPLHPYKLYAKGSVEGPIGDLIKFHKQIQNYELIREGDILLDLGPNTL